MTEKCFLAVKSVKTTRKTTYKRLINKWFENETTARPQKTMEKSVKGSVTAKKTPRRKGWLMPGQGETDEQQILKPKGKMAAITSRRSYAVGGCLCTD